MHARRGLCPVLGNISSVTFIYTNDVGRRIPADRDAAVMSSLKPFRRALSHGANDTDGNEFDTFDDQVPVSPVGGSGSSRTTSMHAHRTVEKICAQALHNDNLGKQARRIRQQYLHL